MQLINPAAILLLNGDEWLTAQKEMTQPSRNILIMLLHFGRTCLLTRTCFNSKRGIGRAKTK
jgi:hypothetical protein